MTQQNYTPYEYPPPGYQGWQQYQEPPRSKGLGISAMVVGIVALVLSFVPLLGLISFLLGPLALVLGIFAVVKSNGKPQAIAGIVTGLLSFVVVLIGTLLFGAAVSNLDEASRESGGAAAEAVAAEEEAEDAAEVAEAQEDEAEDAEPAGDPGSRDNPHAFGETVTGGDWEVTVNGVTRNADDAIAAANQFNDPSPEGSSYALVDVSVTYHGEDSELAMLETGFAYVTESGETISSHDHIAVTPDAFDSTRELYNGGTEQGNISLAIPDEDDGTVRVRIGLFGAEDHFYVSE